MYLRLALLLLLTLLIACDEQPRAANKPGAVPLTPAARPGSEAPPLSAENKQVVSSTVSGSNAFAGKMYGALKGEPGNLFFSPYSITTALGMAYEGAKGDTASEIQALFGFPAETTARQSAFGALHDHLNPQNAGYKLSIANSFWAQQGFDFLPEYTDVLRQHYSAEASTVDFIGATEATRKRINKWVDGKTEHRIPELFDKGKLTPATVLALVNAIYFKGQWESPFDPAYTRDREFRTPDGKVQVPMMMRKTDFDYGENDKVQVVTLPYADSKLEMLIVLPKQDAITAAEYALLAGQLDALPLSSQRLTVLLPKFKFDAGYELNDNLAQLGMPSAFDAGAADFSGMDGTRELFIGVVIHKAWVQVDEEGTEAAAATGIGMDKSGAATNPLVFNADHPFLFVIRDRESGVHLFIGRVEDPTA